MGGKNPAGRNLVQGAVQMSEEKSSAQVCGRLATGTSATAPAPCEEYIVLQNYVQCFRTGSVMPLSNLVGTGDGHIPTSMKPKAPEPTKTTGTAEDQKKIAEFDKASRAEELRAKEEKRKHEEEIARSDKLWRERADAKRWDEVVADLDVYKFSGQSRKIHDGIRNIAIRS